MTDRCPGRTQMMDQKNWVNCSAMYHRIRGRQPLSSGKNMAQLRPYLKWTSLRNEWKHEEENCQEVDSDIEVTAGFSGKYWRYSKYENNHPSRLGFMVSAFTLLWGKKKTHLKSPKCIWGGVISTFGAKFPKLTWAQTALHKIKLRSFQIRSVQINQHRLWIKLSTLKHDSKWIIDKTNHLTPRGYTL